MIFEIRSYTLQSRTVATVEERFERALAERTQLSPLGGFWRTEVGMLNQVIALWPYESMAERERIRAEARKLKTWPPQIGEFVIERSANVFVPAPFSPPIEPRTLGNLYEIRTYTYAPGSIPGVIKAWEELLEERLKYSPLVAVGHSELGALDKWVHIWAYKDAGDRERIREATAKAGIWPISVVDKRLNRPPQAVSRTMQNMLVIPTRFSPLR